MATAKGEAVGPPVRVVVDGFRYWLTAYPEGLTLHMRLGAGRLVQWAEVARLAEGPPADRFGLVVDGRLASILDDETAANDRAAEQRRLGSDAGVIRVPVPVLG
jgi:hypothetical protein